MNSLPFSRHCSYSTITTKWKLRFYNCDNSAALQTTTIYSVHDHKFGHSFFQTLVFGCSLACLVLISASHIRTQLPQFLCSWRVFDGNRKQPAESGKQRFIPCSTVNFPGIRPIIDDYICLFFLLFLCNYAFFSSVSFRFLYVVWHGLAPPSFGLVSVSHTSEAFFSWLNVFTCLHWVVLSATVRQTGSNLWNWNYFRVCAFVYGFWVRLTGNESHLF